MGFIAPRREPGVAGVHCTAPRPVAMRGQRLYPQSLFCCTMHKVVGLPVGVDILGANRTIANKIAKTLRRNKVRSFDFMGSIGSGKTLLIENIIDHLKSRSKACGVIAGDVAGDDDYRRFRAHGVQVFNVNTGKECHLDAHLIEHALEHFDLQKIDALFIENVGNLVCPADFPLGAQKRIVVISVTEGDDMVRKHPVIFATSDIIVINKTDLAEAMEVDPQILARDAKKANPHGKIILTSARAGDGMGQLLKAMGL